MLKISNLVKKYNDQLILENVRLVADDPRKIYTLIGKSGSGNTTLFNIIFGLDNDFSGSCKLFGRETKEFNSNEWNYLRSNDIRIVFQDYKLLDQLTVYENLYYAGNYTEAAIHSVLEEMDLLELKNADIHSLSGGQKQRVAIARAVIGTPKMILLDEPTGNLDSMTTDLVMEYLSKLRDKGILIFIITHDENIMNHADTVYKLENKHIILEKDEIDSIKSTPSSYVGDQIQKKHILKYTMTNIFKTKKKLLLLGIPIIIILSVFILGFTSFQNASVVSFKRFFSGIDERTISFSTTALTHKSQENLNRQQITSLHDGKRLAFSEADINTVKDIPHVEQAAVILEGVTSQYDYERNILQEVVTSDQFPRELKKYIAATENTSIEFLFEPITVPYSLITHYNDKNINLIAGDFPHENTTELLLPDIYALIINNGNLSNIVNKEISLNVKNIDSDQTFNKKYSIAGVYQTSFQNKIDSHYKIYTGYVSQLDQTNYLSEDSYNHYKEFFNRNKADANYSEELIKNYDSYLTAMGTGYNQMIVVVDDVKNVTTVHEKLSSLFPKFQFISQYDIKHGELSSTYQQLVLVLVVGSCFIALILGIVIVFLNKSHISYRNYELAILYSQGYSRKDIFKSITLENTFIFSIYLICSYTIASLLNIYFLSKTRHFALFAELISWKNIFSVFLLVNLIVLVSIIWGIIGVNKKNLAKNLNK